MNRVKLSECKLNLEKLQNIICISVFGSYNEECFDKNRSDIDIMILSNEELDWQCEMNIEDYLDSIFKIHFNHDNIHYTFINEFNYPFSDQLIASNDKLIFNEEKYFDYILGYSTFKRDREILEDIRNDNLKFKEEVTHGLL